MSAAPETQQETRRHPFPAAIERGDHSALVATLAPDVVLHAAATLTKFEGRETVGEVYASVIESFDELEVVDELSSGDTLAFFWRGRMDGRFVEGADRLRLDGAGNVREITVTGRPLSGLATFLTGIGPRFARRRQGPVVAAILKLTAWPLPRLFAMLDPVTRWLARPRRQPGDRSA
jgi:ketosteroid isomerase-like protein